MECEKDVNKNLGKLKLGTLDGSKPDGLLYKAAQKALSEEMKTLAPAVERDSSKEPSGRKKKKTMVKDSRRRNRKK